MRFKTSSLPPDLSLKKAENPSLPFCTIFLEGTLIRTRHNFVTAVKSRASPVSRDTLCAVSQSNSANKNENELLLGFFVCN